MEYQSPQNDTCNITDIPVPPSCAGLDEPIMRLHLYSDEQLRMYFYTPFQEVLVTVMYPLVSAFGLFGNVAFLLVVLCNPHMRTITNFYLANLAVADLIFVLFETGHVLWQCVALQGLNFGSIFSTRAGCFAAITVTYLTYFASVCIVVLVSFERFMAVCHPLRSRRMRTMKRTVILIAISWFVALLFAVIVALLIGNMITFCIVWPNTDTYASLPNLHHMCAVGKVPHMFVFQFVQGVPFFVALVLNTYFYARILCRLSRRAVTRDDQRLNNVRTRRSVVRMLAINSVIFFVCLAPNHLINWANLYAQLAEEQFHNSNWFYTLAIIMRFTLLVNSAVNPYVYGAINIEYRVAFYQTLARGRCCGRSGTTVREVSSWNQKTTEMRMSLTSTRNSSQ